MPHCLRAALASVTHIPLEAVIDVLDGTVTEYDWWERVVEWGASKGLAIDAVEDAPEGIAIGVGVTERRPGEQHAVVCYGGQPVFDPHPSDAMLDAILYFITVSPTSLFDGEVA